MFHVGRIQMSTIYSQSVSRIKHLSDYLPVPDYLKRVSDHLPQVYSFLSVISICCTVLLLVIITVRIGCLVKTSILPPVHPKIRSIFDIYDLAKTAYEKGHIEAVMTEVEQQQQLDVNMCAPNQGLSLFMCACLSGQRRLIQFLLEKGGNPHSCTKEGDSPLYLATYGILNSPDPDFYAIDVLLKAGCNVNKSNNRGYTPLHRAASKGHSSLVKYLLMKGADPYKCNKAGIYPIDSAVNAGHVEVAESLRIEVDNPHVWDLIEPHTPLHISLGLMSPRRRLMVESPRPKLRSVFTT